MKSIAAIFVFIIAIIAAISIFWEFMPFNNRDKE